MSEPAASQALIFALIAGGLLVVASAVVLLAQLFQRLRMARDLEALQADIALTENVAGIGYWSMPAGTDIGTWSSGMYEIFGRDPKTFIPSFDNALSAVLPQYVPALVALNDPEATGRKGGDVEARVLCPDGKVKDVLVATRYRYTRTGRFKGLFGVVADITARKVAERAIAEREEQLQRAISAMGAAIWDWDIPSDKLFAGPRFAEILGLDPQAFKPTMTLHHQLCHPEDLPRVLDAFRDHVRTGAPYDIEYRMMHNAGHYVWVHSRGRVVSYHQTKPVRVIGTVVDVSARHRVEEDLRRSRESLELAVQASQAGYFDVAHISGSAFWSPRAREILGGEAEDFRPTPVTLPQLMHPDDISEFMAHYAEFETRHVPLDSEVRVRHKDGRYVWIHVRAVPQLDAEGKLARSIGFIHDISSRKQAQLALVDSERKFRNLIEGSLQGVVIMRKDKALFCNLAYARMLGYDRVDDVLNLDSLTVHVPADNMQESLNHWDMALRRELEGKVLKHRMLDRLGRSRWFESVERLIQWEGEPARQLVVLDVTENETIQRTLRASEERFRLLADNISDVITLYDQDHVFRYVSPSVEHVTGYKADDVIGRSVFFWQMDHSAEDVARLNQTVTGNAIVWQLKRKDGTPVWVESTSSRVAAPAGERGYAVVSALRDVTERVEREAELAAARDRLTNQAEELTVLAQNLDVERERAEAANAAKSQFLAMMSHELRTPMTGVMGMADLLLMSTLTAEQEDVTKLLKRSARVLLDLLNDILDFSKIEAGQLEIESIPFHVSEILADVTNLFGPVASEKGIVLDTKTPPAFWDGVKGDPKRLRQVLSNLVGNAIKFTEEGHITIAFEQLLDDGDNVTLQFSVSDTGIGIAEEEAGRLFQPFVQADVSTSRKYGGTGLGLAISRRLVEGMGGEIKLTSEVGKGSTFTFTVKSVIDRTAPKLEAQPQRRRSFKPGKPAAVSRTILLAEDNDTSRYLISTMLARMGHTVDAVEHGGQAVAAAQAKAYDIILMDMQMPVMDGPDATRQIRASKSPNAKVPVIALTADVIADHRSSYFAAGVNAIVGKPVNWAELSEEMERQLANREGAKKMQSKTPAPAKPEKPGPLDDLKAAVVLDESALATLADALGEDVLAPMLETFRANMNKYRDDLGAHVTASDLKQAKRTGHALKGLCAQFGAMRVSGYGKFIEMDAASIDDVRAVLTVLAETIAATETALAARRARVTGSAA